MMRKILLIMLCSAFLFGSEIVKTSNCSVDDTIYNLKNIIKKRGLTFFALINYKGEAQYVDMKLNKAKMLIFGSAKITTPLMQQDMLVGLGLPIKILVFMDNDGKVKMAYNDGSWLRDKNLRDSQKLSKQLERTMDEITKEARQCKQD